MTNVTDTNHQKWTKWYVCTINRIYYNGWLSAYLCDSTFHLVVAGCIGRCACGFEIKSEVVFMYFYDNKMNEIKKNVIYVTSNPCFRRISFVACIYVIMADLLKTKAMILFAFNTLQINRLLLWLKLGSSDSKFHNDENWWYDPTIMKIAFASRKQGTSTDISWSHDRNTRGVANINGDHRSRFFSAMSAIRVLLGFSIITKVYSSSMPPPWYTSKLSFQHNT